MATKQGSLSINSENIFPVIKKWLYSDHDIFFRELISNGCDAITKLKKLELIGEFEAPEDNKYKVTVLADSNEKTLTFIDNGIGMTADEVDEYINQIAFSGAEAFLAQYKDKTNEDQIIGHFGLGFYSAFMVADHVTIETLSYKEGATGVKWDCDGGTEFSMENCDKNERGTKITLYLNDDCVEFANEFRAREVIEKYCSFMPVEIYLENPNAEEKNETVNDTNPLWNKHPNECSKEEYIEFYRKVFNDYKEPLFWIHLNMDYPFNLKGILYFPKIDTQYESIEGTIKLYNNQVFIADNIKEVIPEFLLLLKGVIDCPDLPLNVSRSALQNDGFVKKISDYITKKVADKLSGMCKTDKESYEKYWDDISPFIKFGCIRDEKFCEKMNDYILFKNIDGKYLTFKECLEENKEEHENTIFYVDDLQVQSQYINMFKDEGMDAIILDHNIDNAFITHLEQKNEGVHFLRIDADITDNFKDDVAENELDDVKEKLTTAFRTALNNENLDVKVEKLKNEKISSLITMSEEGRRMQDMMKMYNLYGMDMGMKEQISLVLNANNNLVKYIIDNPDGENTPLFCKQLFDLAIMSNRQLNADEMTAFIERSNQILELLAK